VRGATPPPLRKQLGEGLGERINNYDPSWPTAFAEGRHSACRTGWTIAVTVDNSVSFRRYDLYDARRASG